MHKAISVQTKDNYKIKVAFEDGKVVLYDIKPLFSMIPAFRVLQMNRDLYRSARIEQDGTVISWTENLNLDAKMVWAQGTLLEFTKKPDVNHLLAYRMQVSRFFAGMTQKELAEKTGIYQADISKFERGQGNPSLNTLKRIAEGLNMDLFVDFRYPVEENSEANSGGEDMGRLAERKSGVCIIKPEMTTAFMEHMRANRKPDDYWEECAKSRELPKETLEHMRQLIWGEENE